MAHPSLDDFVLAACEKLNSKAPARKRADPTSTRLYARDVLSDFNLRDDSEKPVARASIVGVDVKITPLAEHNGPIDAAISSYEESMPSGEVARDIERDKCIVDSTKDGLEITLYDVQDRPVRTYRVHGNATDLLRNWPDPIA